MMIQNKIRFSTKHALTIENIRNSDVELCERADSSNEIHLTKKN